MPISWGVNHGTRLVSATGTGVLTKADLDAYLDDLATAATLSYAKVFHMADCRLALSKEELLAIGARIREHEVHESMGRVAVVAVSDELYAQATEFSDKVLAERPLRIFREVATAIAWLDDNARDHVAFAKPDP